MSKPTLLFLHGAFSSPGTYDQVRSTLESHGYETVAVQNPSALGLAETPVTLTTGDDIANARKELEKLVSAGKEVVVIAHSYGGIIGGSIVEGLEKKEVNDGGVVAAVFVSAFLLPKGLSPMELMAAGGAGLPEFMAPHPDNPIFLYVTTEYEAGFHDVPREVAQHHIDMHGAQLSTVYAGKSEGSAWDSVPCSYVIFDGDKYLPPLVQEMMLQNIRTSDSKKFERQLRVESSHCAWKLEKHPAFDNIITFIRGAAGEDVYAVK